MNLRPHTRTLRALRLAALCAACLFSSSPSAHARQEGAAQRAGSSLLVRWPGSAGVGRYRLQVAADRDFKDVVFDGMVEGSEWLVRDVPPGEYFWRIAPARSDVSTFSVAQAVTVPAGGLPVAVPLAPAAGAGWRTATGEVMHLAAAKIRPGAVTDFVGVTATGRVFAVDGANGASLWNARFEGEAAARFAPAVCADSGGVQILTAVTGGVRLLRGDTGREEWRARIEGEARAGMCADLDGDGAFELIVAAGKPAALHVLSAADGRSIFTAELGAEVVGAPVPYGSAKARGLLLALGDGSVQARDARLQVLNAIKLPERPTTAPHLFASGEGEVVAVGCEEGLVWLSPTPLRRLRLVPGVGGPVRATPVSADVDGDGRQEVAVLDGGGRLTLIDGLDGSIRWSVATETAAGEAAFLDLNGDGVLDVVLPGWKDFALAYSGRDGTLLLRAEGGGPMDISGAVGTAGRVLRTWTSANGSVLVVGTEPGGVRAFAAPGPLPRAGQSLRGGGLGH